MTINTRYIGDDYFSNPWDFFSTNLDENKMMGQLPGSDRVHSVAKVEQQTSVDTKAQSTMSSFYKEKNELNSLKSVCFNEKFENNPQQKVLIIPGGNGHLGREFAEKAIQEGYKVIITSRNITKCQDDTNLHFIQVSEDQQSNPDFWKHLISNYSEAESVTLVNAIGSPTAPKGKTLRDVNVLPAKAMAEAMKELEAAGSLRDPKFIHLSSMGSIMLEKNDYGITKKESEDLVKNFGPKNICILRVGYAFQKAVKGEINKIDNTHAYGPEQLSTLPWQPILGSGNQLLQPVFTGDIVEAGLNFKEGIKVINAVGHESITQQNFVGYFCELGNKKFTPIHISMDLAEPLADSFAKGHFSPYAVEGCRRLENQEMLYDTTEFEELIGHKTSTLNDVYGNLIGKTPYFAKPPVSEHIMECVRKIYHNELGTRKNLKKAAGILVKENFTTEINRKVILQTLEDL